MSVKTMAMYDDEDLVRLANQIKEITVGQMEEEGLVSREDADRFLSTQVIIIAKKGLLGRGVDKVLGWLGDREEDSKSFMFASIERKPQENEKSAHAADSKGYAN